MFRLITPVFAQTLSDVETKKWADINPKCIDTATGIATLQGFECIFANMLRIIIPLAGIAAFVILLLGGFQYITSGGDPKQTQKAQSMITGAIIGLAVTVGIWFLFQLLNAVTGLNLLNFAVPGPLAL